MSAPDLTPEDLDNVEKELWYVHLAECDSNLPQPRTCKCGVPERLQALVAMARRALTPATYHHPCGCWFTESNDGAGAIFPHPCRQHSEEIEHLVRNAVRNEGVWPDLVARVRGGSPPARWVPVGERLPESARTVVVVSGYGSFGFARWSLSRGWDLEDNEPLLREHEITHWMPLPEPPEVK